MDIPAKMPMKGPIRIVLSPEALAFIEDMAVNSRRKGEVVEALAEAAQKRLNQIDAGTAPADDLTRVLLELRLLKDQHRLGPDYVPSRKNLQRVREDAWARQPQPTRSPQATRPKKTKEAVPA